MPPDTHHDPRPKHRSPLRDEAKVLELLMKTQSVSLTARMLGVTTPQLSRWLHRAKRREWWEATKAEWSRVLTVERQRRYRSRRAAREGRRITPRKRPDHGRDRARERVRCPLCGSRVDVR